ncbi:hypothetical protein AAZV13_11G184650 [Glycine max]
MYVYFLLKFSFIYLFIFYYLLFIYWNNGWVGTHPTKIKDLVDKTFIFKVDLRITSSYRFEQFFPMKKNCCDVEVINNFKDAWNRLLLCVVLTLQKGIIDSLLIRMTMI